MSYQWVNNKLAYVHSPNQEDHIFAPPTPIVHTKSYYEQEDSPILQNSIKAQQDRLKHLELIRKMAHKFRKSVRKTRKSSSSPKKSKQSSPKKSKKSSPKKSKKSSPKKSKKSSPKKSMRSSPKKSKKRSRKSVSLKEKCQKWVSNKIAINMGEYKDGKYKSPKQAIAVAYSQVLKKHPECKKVLKRKSK